MITGTNLYSAAAALSSPIQVRQNLDGQKLPGKEGHEERIAKVGVKAYAREIQTEKLEEEARARALQSLKLTEEKLEKIGAAFPQKLVEIEANIQEYITEYLQEQIKAELTKEAQEQGRAGYRQGALLDLSA